MKRTSIATLLLLAVGMSTGCGRAKDEVLPDGTKLFGVRPLWWGGTKKAERREYPDGQKDFEVTWLKDGTEKVGRVEFPDGQRDFDMTILPDRTERAARIEFSNGEKIFDDITLPDGAEKMARREFPSGEKQFDVTTLPDGTINAIGRVELPTGERQFDQTSLPDGTKKIARVELPSGVKAFDVTILRDGTQIVGRAKKPDGTDMPTFSTAQNDQQGYADVKWGTASTDLDPNAAGESSSCFVPSGDREGNEAVAAAFGVQTRDTVVAGTVLSTSLDFSAVPAKCKSVTKADVKLIFYDDKLAMAFSHLDAHNYESIASEMASKFAELDGWSVNWGGGAMSDGDSTSLNVRLFKRGNTNTRVFLLKETFHMGCCGTNVSSVYLLYVPNADYLRIRGDMGKMRRDKEAQQVAEKQKSEEPDLRKIQ
jgi:hypothetical protein